MILQQLHRDAPLILKQTTGAEQPPPGYVHKAVRWVVELDDGKKPHIEPLRGLGDDKKADRGTVMLLPERKRSGLTIRPFVFADVATYVFGVDRVEAPRTPEEIQQKAPKWFTDSPTPDKRTAEKHAAFVQIAQLCAEQTGSDAAARVAEFLTQWELDRSILELRPEMDSTHVITFKVNGQYVTEEPAVRAFWGAPVSDVEEGEARDTSRDRMCLLTGLRGPVEEMMPLPVKGLAGGSPMGTHIVSMNFSAGESYGLSRAENSPISKAAGEQFGQALNALLTSPDHYRRVQNSTYVFWASADQKIHVAALEADPEPEEVKKLIAAVEKTKRKEPSPADLDVQIVTKPFDAPHTGTETSAYITSKTPFHIFGLTPNVARVAVRTALTITVKELVDAQGQWFKRLKVPAFDERGKPIETKPLPLKTLAVAGYREFKDIPASVEDALVRCALLGPQTAPLPFSLLSALVMRCRVDTANRVSYPRAALLKFIVTQDFEADSEAATCMENEVTGPLPEGFTEPQATAYHLGRLFCELEAIQKQAIPTINAGIADRFYGSASSTPASVFGILLDGAQSHLAKLRKEGRGAGHGAQQRLTDIMLQLPAKPFPKTLPLGDQALFSLGYYHHRAARRQEIANRKAAKDKAALEGFMNDDSNDDETTEDYDDNE